MSRAGRKRKFRGHSPMAANQDRRPDDKLLAAAQPHRAWLPPDLRLSEKAGTPLGGLNLTNAISDEEYEAGQRWRVLVGEYRASIGIPDAANSGGRGYPCLGMSDCERCECLRRKLAYDEAYHELWQAGQVAMKIVNRVAVQDEKCPYYGLSALKSGLRMLVRHFGLDEQRGRVIR